MTVFNIRILYTSVSIGLMIVILSLMIWNRPVVNATAQAASASYDWLQFGFDSGHSGSNYLERMIAPGNVSSLHKLYQVTLPSNADGAPVYLARVDTPGGTRDLVLMTTLAGHLIALDAKTGTPVWSNQNPAGSCTIGGGGTDPCFSPSSPAIDPGRQHIYAYGLEGNVHKYRVSDGAESVGAGWPETSTLKPIYDKGSSNLSIATLSNGTSYLYMTHAGYNDSGDYQGHITAIDLHDGTQRVFNAVCSDQTVHFTTGGSPNCSRTQAGIWARAGVVYDPDTNKIYTATGNGLFDPANHHWGGTVFELHPNGSGANGDPLDSFTPGNYQYLNASDLDVGSTVPAILPPASGKYPHLGVQGGKEGTLYLLNMDNLSNSGVVSPGLVGGEVLSMTVPQTGEVLTMPAVWVNPGDNTTWIFVANDSGLSGLQLAIDGQGNPSLQTKWTETSQGGTSPVIANGVLYMAGANPSYLGTYFLQARNPTNGNVLWEDDSLGKIHWSSPIVANGILYIADGNAHFTAYAPDRIFFLPVIFR